MNTRENAIELALEAIKNGACERKIAKDFGIPRTTLYNRRTGIPSRCTGHAHQQRLSPEQEELCDWIVEQEACGYAPSHKRSREMVILMLKLSGDEKPLGKRWISNFIKRNPRIATMIGKPIESSRIRGTQPEQINIFYENSTRFGHIPMSDRTMCGTWMSMVLVSVSVTTLKYLKPAESAKHTFSHRRIANGFRYWSPLVLLEISIEIERKT